MQHESMGGDDISASSEAANKAFSQAMSSYAAMSSNMHYSAAPSQAQQQGDLTPTGMYQQQQQQNHQLLNSAAVMNAGAITCLVCYNAQVNIMLEPCRHQFHVHCIDRWLNKDKVCPVCWIPIQSHRPIVSQFAPPNPQSGSGGVSSPVSGGGYAPAATGGPAPNGTHGGGMLSGPAASSILPAQAAANMEHPNPPSMRKGKWTSEESAYCDRLIEEFKKGNLPLAEGTTLRTFLSKLLNCDPMRISKKYTGDQCIGKIIFRRREDELTKEEMEMIRRDLADLEKTYLEREQYNQRRREKRLESELSRDKNRFMAAARNASGGSTPNGNTNPMANFNVAAAAAAANAAAAVNALRPPPPAPFTQQNQAGMSTPNSSAQSNHHQQQAYHNQLAAQQRQQMLAAAQAQAQAQAHRSAQAQAQSLAPPPRHPPMQQQQAYNGPPGRLPKDEFSSESATSSVPLDISGASTNTRVSTVSSAATSSSDANANSMSRVSSIDSFGCLFPRVASVDGFGSATNLASYGASSTTTTASTTGANSDSANDHTGEMVKSISIGDGLSAYFPRVQSLEHLSSLLQEHAPSSPSHNLNRLHIKSEHQHSSDDAHMASDDSTEQEPTAVQIRDADVSKKLSPNNSHANKNSSLADYANQIQAPKPLSKMPRSSSGIFPRVPSMDKMPRVPSTDKLPRIPSMDKLPALDNIPRAPSMSKLPRVPSLDKHLSRVSSNSDMLSRFGSSDHLSGFPSFTNLAGLSSSMSYDKLSALGGAAGQGAFRAGGFPRNSSIEDILSLVASSETGGLSSNNSSLQLSALAALAGEESAANDRKRRMESISQNHGSSGGGMNAAAAESTSDTKKSRVSA